MSNIIKGAAEIAKAVDAWTSRGTKWVKEGQSIALSCLQHLADHGDIGAVNRLVTKMPKGTKSGSMIAYFLEFGSLVANEGSDKKEKPLVYSKEKATDMVGAAKTPWQDCGKQEQTAEEVFDVVKAVHAIINKAKKANSVSDTGMLEQLMALCGAEDEPTGEPDSVPETPSRRLSDPRA